MENGTMESGTMESGTMENGMSNVSLELEDDIAWITLDDGKANVMSRGMLEALDTRLDEAAACSRVTVLSGRAGIFSAGFDLKTFERGADASAQMLDAGVRVIIKMLEHPTPILSACTGHAYPMGAFLLLASDVRIGMEGDWRIGLNEVAIGITLPHFAIALARHRLSPSGFARVTTGAMFDPQQAEKAGYLDYVVSADAFAGRCKATARQLLTLDATAYRATKERINAPVRAAILAGHAY
jgi:enoyl-CoA hydratase